MQFEYGVLQQIAPDLRRLVCHNPNAFTFKGTNTYVLGTGNVAVIDPGPAPGEQLDMLCEQLSGERITHILLTHCHSDHSGAAELLQRAHGRATLWDATSRRRSVSESWKQLRYARGV